MWWPRDTRPERELPHVLGAFNPKGKRSPVLEDPSEGKVVTSLRGEQSLFVGSLG